MGEPTGTKERIAQVAMALFAQKGYEAVSIRDICGEVGIKESTLYYHFENKRAILAQLLERVEALAERKRARFDAALDRASDVTPEEMQRVAVFLLTDYLLNPDVRSLLDMLSIERMHNESAQRAYRRIVFELPLAQQEKAFGRMLARGLIRAGDPRGYAELYYGAVYGAWHRFLVGCDAEATAVERASEQICRDIGLLYEWLRRDEA